MRAVALALLAGAAAAQEPPATLADALARIETLEAALAASERRARAAQSRAASLENDRTIAAQRALRCEPALRLAQQEQGQAERRAADLSREAAGLRLRVSAAERDRRRAEGEARRWRSQAQRCR